MVIRKNVKRQNRKRMTRTKPKEQASGYTPRVVVKFRDFVQLPYQDGADKYLDKMNIGPWQRLAELFPGIRLRRMFIAVKSERIRQLVNEAVRRDNTYRPPNFLTYFIVDCPADVNPEEVAKALSTWKSVELAYVDPPGQDPVVDPTDDPQWPNQGYLDPQPDGIDAEFAWGLAGGDGAGQHVIDLEQGWTLDHEDLVAHGATLLVGALVDGSRRHGTNVLGEICAVDNALGCVGIAPNVESVNVVSHSGMLNSIPNAIMTAVDSLPFGGVLLLEVQIDFLPAETVPANFDTIRLATALGLIVVEAAGNGATDLDLFTDAGGDQILNRASADFQDSGAIVVGAATSTVPHERDPDSNFGTRIDCYAWGDSVVTTSSNDFGATDLYSNTFSNTSAASPIITGAALVVQGVAEAQLGFKFSPWQMRSLLSNPLTGTASDDPPNDRIGVMPNLAAVLTGDEFGFAPDVYLRDFVGDTGDDHVGAISASPDIILRPVAEVSPQDAFGEGSGTENSNTLGFEAEAGQDNFIYVRVRNRGAAVADDVTATVFWSPPATLVTPDLWTLVGSAVIDNVPEGDILTVSDAITWPSAEIPAPGHYCFVGLVGNTDDPPPSPVDFIDFENFRSFIRSNNNVTWRNFNVVDNEPDPDADPSGFVAMAFLAPGAPDRARRMRLEVAARLPKGSRALLEMPIAMFDMMRDRQPAKIDKKRQVALVPVNPHGRVMLGEMLFTAKSRARLRLLVQIPKDRRRMAYEVLVRQMYKDEEVGRITWRLTPLGGKRRRPKD